MKNETPLPELEHKSIGEIAEIISQDWKKVYFGAVPYLNAMQSLSSIDSKFGYDDGRSIVLYFLSNAQTWRGPVAKHVKAHLNKLVKGK